MAATEQLEKIVVNNAVSIGTTSTGAVRTANVSIGTLDPTHWDVQKAYNILNAMDSILEEESYKYRSVATNEIVYN